MSKSIVVSLGVWNVSYNWLFTAHLFLDCLSVDDKLPRKERGEEYNIYRVFEKFYISHIYYRLHEI